jgi:hypothetical protein
MTEDVEQLDRRFWVDLWAEGDVKDGARQGREVGGRHEE